MASSASSPPASLSSQMEIPLVGSSVAVVRHSSRILLDLLRTRFQCEAQIVGLDLDSDRESPTARPPVVPEKRLESWLPSGVKVSVWRGDLANFAAEAVVNAANTRLQHHGGLALALSQAGGAQVQLESDDYVARHGFVKTGDAVALGPGKLKCKTIIHAVGPKLSYIPNAHEVNAATPQLEKVVRRILELVEKKTLDTVAIPAISSGIFNFPLPQCANTIVSSVMKFYGSSTSHRFKPKEVLLVNIDDPTVKEMEWACKKLLPQNVSTSQATNNSPHTSMTYSQAAGGKPQPSTSPVLTRGAKSKTPPPRLPQVQLGLMQVLLRKGRLEEQTMDVIVNTASPDRKLSVGRVSNALLTKAGRKMQEEIRSASFHKSILITGGYNLQSRQVYHTFCPDRTKEGSPQALFQSVQDCLECAINARYSSIVFPAIGTGALGFKNREAAQVMVTAVNDFSQRCKVPFEVHFVIFERDLEVFKAFEEELRSLRVQVEQMQSSHMSAGAAPSQLSSAERRLTRGWEEEPQKTPSEPCLRLQSSSLLNSREAEAWLTHLLRNQFSTVCIPNNFTQLLGESEMEELSQTQVEGVLVEEFLERGRSGLIVSGDKREDIAVTALKFEQMLQKVQREFLKEEEEELRRAARCKVKMEKIRISRSDSHLTSFINQLQRRGIHTLTAEQVENPALEKVFKAQQAQMASRSEDLLQLVSAQFCDMVGHIGFRPECAPPDDSSLGEGVYFAADIQTALRTWTGSTDHFLYVFVAEVLKGRPGRGRPGLVLAPGLDSGAGPEPGSRYDSVEGSGLTVIFNPHQALPKYVLTCRKEDDISSV